MKNRKWEKSSKRATVEGSFLQTCNSCLAMYVIQNYNVEKQANNMSCNYDKRLNLLHNSVFCFV